MPKKLKHKDTQDTDTQTTQAQPTTINNVSSRVIQVSKQ